jgi:uncharacterized membrane protein
VSILFYVNLLLLTLVIYFVAAKTSRPRRFAAINVAIAISYSLVFMSTIGDSHENMLFLVDHYWILALALHWFLLATFFVFRKQPSDL